VVAVLVPYTAYPAGLAVEPYTPKALPVVDWLRPYAPYSDGLEVTPPTPIPLVETPYTDVPFGLTEEP
jgi:hypothetical protein